MVCHLTHRFVIETLTFTFSEYLFYFVTFLFNVCAHFHCYSAHAYANTRHPPTPVDTRDTVADSGVMVDVSMVITS